MSSKWRRDEGGRGGGGGGGGCGGGGGDPKCYGLEEALELS